MFDLVFVLAFFTFLLTVPRKTGKNKRLQGPIKWHLVVKLKRKKASSSRSWRHYVRFKSVLRSPLEAAISNEFEIHSLSFFCFVLWRLFGQRPLCRLILFFEPLFRVLISEVCLTGGLPFMRVFCPAVAQWNNKFTTPRGCVLLFTFGQHVLFCCILSCLHTPVDKQQQLVIKPSLLPRAQCFSNCNWNLDNSWSPMGR